MQKSKSVSLLWPNGEPATHRPTWSNPTVDDLGLEQVIQALNTDGKHERSIRSIFLTPCHDADTLSYRQEVIADLLNVPELLQDFENLMPKLGDLAFYTTMSEAEALPFQRTLGRLGELELYIQIVNTFSDFLNKVGSKIESRGLASLREMLMERKQHSLFTRMEQALPDITARVSKLASITLGINLDHNLKPIGATLISINTEPFRGSSFFKNLFGDHPEFQGISQLHTVPMKSMNTADGRILSTHQRSDPMLFPLFKDLDRVISDTVRPIATALREFLRVSTQFLSLLEPEMAFYTGAARLILDLQGRGLPMCRAEVATPEERICIIHDCYNLNLALRLMAQSSANLSARIVGNDVSFDDDGRILIITGPNQGGKTTFIQAIGLAQMLFQAGLPVPGSSARISPVEGIYTHFPVEEKPSAETGRFGEEAQRLSGIFDHATRHSLILLNESLASTASGESLYLAGDIVRCLRLLGVRAAYTTHMHELAEDADKINEATPGDSRVISLVSMVQPAVTRADGYTVQHTYKIIPSPPMGRSYARELAARYGISFDKIVETLSARQVIDTETLDKTAW